MWLWWAPAPWDKESHKCAHKLALVCGFMMSPPVLQKKPAKPFFCNGKNCKTKAEIGEGNVMDVSGVISAGGNRIFLDGYCSFKGS